MTVVHRDLGTQYDGAILELLLDDRADVLILDPANYRRYCLGVGFHAYGGHGLHTPLRLPLPGAGHWHAVVTTADPFAEDAEAIRVRRPLAPVPGAGRAPGRAAATPAAAASVPLAA
ncbi:DUF1883 domain-containing protein [Patulibacter sp. SYSU D01012]|uniref:DUF1883 domain-containing protein n=1 Tax=Patulibacter sp. SYSU D01012 TaxID=2817381 RepID=UPI001B3147E5|nr:DUF1883 domain-containing protein [Patulibacter sp. SYSU D01012]